jgi:protein-S-isoprenylcysteine O-methyltransferase Ste14
LTGGVLAIHPVYSGNLIATALFSGLVAVWVAGEVAIRVRSLLRTGAQERDRGSYLVIVGSLLVGFAGGAALASAFPGAAFGEGQPALAVAALVLLALGVALRFYAVLVLGRLFTVTVMVGSDQRVVDTGPYRFVRHPSYTGLLLAIAGILLSWGNWAAMLGLLPILAGLAYRIRVEERALTEQLGDVYRAYAQRTKRLIPFVF